MPNFCEFEDWSKEMMNRAGKLLPGLETHLREVWDQSQQGVKSAKSLQDPLAQTKSLFREIKGLTDSQASDIQKALYQGNTAEARNMIRLAMYPTTWQKFLAGFNFYRDNGLLSGTATPLTKGFSDTTMQGLRILERSIVNPAEGAASLNGALSSLPDMFRAIGDGLKNGLQPGDIDLSQEGGLRRQINPLGDSWLARAVGYPFKAIQAFDKGAKVLAGRANLAALAHREGVSRGLSGQALEDFKQQAFQNPESIQGLLPKLTQAVQRDTFNADLPGVAGTLSRLSQTNPYFHFILPFVKVPYNIFKEGLLRTPAGFAMALRDLKSGKLTPEGFRDEIAKPILGTTIMAMTAAAAKAGLITGSGPPTGQERTNLLQTGWKPYSLHLGDTYVSYHRLEPIATMVGAAADLVEAYDQSDHAKAGELVDKGMQSLTSNIMSKSYIVGMENFFGALQDPKRAMPRFIESAEGSLVPTILAKTAQTIDPTIRKVSAKDLSPIESRIPFLSETLPAARTPLGATETRNENPVERTVSNFTPFDVGTERPGANVEREFNRLGMAPPTVSKVFTLGNKKVHYSDEEFDQINKMAGDIARPQLEELMQSDDYKNLPDEYKEKFIRKITSEAHAYARTAVRPKVLQRLSQ